MKLEVSKYYESRDGLVWGPFQRSFSSARAPDAYNFTCGGEWWREDGVFWTKDKEHANDLIREVPAPGTTPEPAEDFKLANGITKPQLHLIPTVAMTELAASLADGASRYRAWNWRDTRVKASTYISAIMRHTAAYRDGEDLTQDSLVTHLGAIMANCAILLDAAKHDKLEDDRPRV